MQFVLQNVYFQARGSGTGMAPNIRQAISWTNDERFTDAHAPKAGTGIDSSA